MLSLIDASLPITYLVSHACRRGSTQPKAAAQSLLGLPEEILRAIMSQLVGNEAVKLASLHPALRRALRMLPSLQPSVKLDVAMIRGSQRTRGASAAEQARRRRSASFGAFRSAHPSIAIEAMTVRLPLSAVLPRRVVGRVAAFDTDCLPLRSLRRLRVETCTCTGGPAPQGRPPSRRRWHSVTVCTCLAPAA